MDLLYWSRVQDREGLGSIRLDGFDVQGGLLASVGFVVYLGFCRAAFRTSSRGFRQSLYYITEKVCGRLHAAIVGGKKGIKIEARPLKPFNVIIAHDRYLDSSAFLS